MPSAVTTHKDAAASRPAWIRHQFAREPFRPSNGRPRGGMATALCGHAGENGRERFFRTGTEPRACHPADAPLNAGGRQNPRVQGGQPWPPERSDEEPW